MILLFGYIFGAAGDSSLVYNLHYLNEDTYTIGGEVYSYNPADVLLENLGLNNETRADELNLELKKTNFDPSETDPEDYMKNNEIPYLLVIPQGWSAQVNESKVNPTAPKALVDYYYDPSYTSSIEVQALIGNVLQNMNSEILEIPSYVIIDIETTPGREGLSYIDFYVPGVIMVTISTAGMMGMVASATEDRESGILFKLATTPMKKWEWALSHELWQIIMGIIVAILTVITGWLAFDFTVSMIHPLMILVLIFGTMTFAGLALIIARFVKRTDGAMAATMSFVFPQMFLSGTIMPAEILPEFMQIIAKIFPLYYVSEAMRSLMLESTRPNFWLPFGVTVAMGFVFFIAGSIITIWKKE
ncbi:MAG: hypothetical protein GF308_07535 [Candidatus Heimdallarchaeota archaeon]|nr:hypothetical protein [Candidatus Heimdallarchaeota archaeon]